MIVAALFDLAENVIACLGADPVLQGQVRDALGCIKFSVNHKRAHAAGVEGFIKDFYLICCIFLK